MIDRKKKFFLSLVVLATLIVSIAITVGTMGHVEVGHAQQALRKGVSATDYYTAAGSDPWGTAFDSKGRVWLAMPGCDPSPYCSNSTPPGKILVFDPSTSSWVNNYQLPSGYGQPLFLAFDKQGMLWFSMPMSNTIGRFNPANSSFQQWNVPTASSGPWGITVDHNGIVWFAEHYGNKIGSFNPSNQSFKEIATPAGNSQPYGITVDGSNNVWFTENNPSVALIGEYTAQGQLKEYKIRNSLPGNNLTPHLITVDPNGNIWWSEGWVAMVGELKVAQAQPGTINGVTEYHYQPTCGNCGTHTSGISVDSYGKIWFDDSLQSIYGSFSDTGTGTFALYNTPTSNSHPHDGLNADKQNRIWFDEEFANKLAEVTQSGTGGGPTPTPTTPTPTPQPGKTLGKDTFQRANQTYWGSASDGQKWGGDANNVSAFSIAGNAGVVANGGGNSYSAVLGPAAANAQGLVSGSLSSYSGDNFGPVLRWTDGNDWYKAYIDGANLVIQKKVAGTATVLANTPFAPKTGTSYTIRFQVVGTALSARVWATGSTEPSGWMATATDNSLSSGYCGIRALTQGGVSATFTSFQATAM